MTVLDNVTGRILEVNKAGPITLKGFRLYRRRQPGPNAKLLFTNLTPRATHGSYMDPPTDHCKPLGVGSWLLINNYLMPNPYLNRP